MTKLLDVAMVRNFEVMLGQPLKHCLEFLLFCAMSYLCKLFNLLNNVS